MDIQTFDHTQIPCYNCITFIMCKNRLRELMKVEKSGVTYIPCDILQQYIQTNTSTPTENDVLYRINNTRDFFDIKDMLYD